MEAKKVATKRGSEFHVLLGDFKLSADAEKRIEATIQRAVMSELAGYKPNPDDPDGTGGPWGPIGNGGGPVVFIPPLQWRGLIAIRDLLKQDQLKQIQEQFKTPAFG